MAETGRRYTDKLVAGDGLGESRRRAPRDLLRDFKGHVARLLLRNGEVRRVTKDGSLPDPEWYTDEVQGAVQAVEKLRDRVALRVFPSYETLGAAFYSGCESFAVALNGVFQYLTDGHVCERNMGGRSFEGFVYHRIFEYFEAREKAAEREGYASGHQVEFEITLPTKQSPADPGGNISDLHFKIEVDSSVSPHRVRIVCMDTPKIFADNPFLQSLLRTVQERLRTLE